LLFSYPSFCWGSNEQTWWNKGIKVCGDVENQKRLEIKKERKKKNCRSYPEDVFIHLHVFALICGFFRVCCSNSTFINVKKETPVETKFSHYFSMCCRLKGQSVYRGRKDGQMFPI